MNETIFYLEQAPQCQVTKGNRINVWKDHKDMTKQECISKCVDDEDCLMWQHMKNKNLCRIHKLEGKHVITILIIN